MWMTTNIPVTLLSKLNFFFRLFLVILDSRSSRVSSSPGGLGLDLVFLGKTLNYPGPSCSKDG